MSARSIAASASAARRSGRAARRCRRTSSPRRSPISATRPEIWEVILTGGDPLMMAPRRLAELIAALDAIEHVARDPHAQPRADRRSRPGHRRAGGRDEAAPRRAVARRALQSRRASSAPATRAALARLADAGIPLMGQTVLLAGVNDDVETLDQLMRALVTARVKPYYLHHPDLVRGTGHFRVSIARGQELMRALARPAVGPGPADLRARRAGRPRQGADRPGLSRRRSRRAAGAGRVRRDAPLSAADLPSGSRCRSGPAPRPPARPAALPAFSNVRRHRHLLALGERRLQLMQSR